MSSRASRGTRRASARLNFVLGVAAKLLLRAAQDVLRRVAVGVFGVATG
jgi:hypothetical protein